MGSPFYALVIRRTRDTPLWEGFSLRAMLGVFLCVALLLGGAAANVPGFRVLREALQDTAIRLYGVVDWPAQVAADVGARVRNFAFAFERSQKYTGLKQDYAALQAEVTLLRTHAERLQQELHYAGPLQGEALTVPVRGVVEEEGTQTLLLGAGYGQDLDVRQAVVARGYLLGRLVEVGQHSSRAMVLSDPGFHVPVYGARSEAQALASGDGTRQLKLKPAAGSTAFQEGEQLLTSGEGGVFPRGLLVGTLHRKEEGDIWAQLVLEPRELNDVQVLKSLKESALEDSPS